MHNPYDEPYESACPECGEDSTNGRLCFSCKRQLEIDNYDFDGWIFCPECGSGCIMQNDWRVALYKCEICHTPFGSGEVLHEGDE